MPSRSPESSQELRYPPIRVNRTLASLDLNTLIMRSHPNPRRLPEEAHSALEESSYEVLGESVFDISDDEGHTESLASTEGHTPDDVSSISDDDEFDDDYMEEDASQHFSPPLAEATDDQLGTHQITSPDDSTFTELADKGMSESSHLRLEEISLSENSDLDACGLIKEFDQTSGLPDILQPYGCPEVRLTVRMALSQQFMSVSESFRLLYVGDLPDWAEKDISRQIGTALDAPPSSSRFNIVRGQLEPSGPALDVDHCSIIRIQDDAGQLSQVMLTLDDGSRLTFGPGMDTQVRGTAPLPDLVIFYHSTSAPPVSSSDKESEKFCMVRNAFRQRQVPVLDVALARPFGRCPEAFTSDAKSLRLCVEGRKDQDSDYEIQESLPIDIYDFIKIEPSQLNRHLACIKSYALEYTSSRANGEDRSWHFRHIAQGLKKGFANLGTRDWLAQQNLWMTVIPLTTMLICLSSVFLTLLPYSSTSQVEIRAPVPLFPTTTSITAASFSVVSPPPYSMSTQRDLTVVASEEQHSTVQREKLREQKLRQENTGSFEIQVTGNHQFVVRHPKHIINGRRKNNLHVEVSRDSKNIPIRFNSTSGVVDIEHEYPLSLFNVSIVVRSRPLLQQSFEITLGFNKSTFSYIKDNVDRLSQIVKQDLALAQSNLQNLTTAVSRTFQAGVIRIENGTAAAFNRTRYWKQQVHDSTQSVAGHLQEAKNMAAHQMSIGTVVTKHLPKPFRRHLEDYTSRVSEMAHAIQGARLPDLWKLSQPVRTHPHVLEARRRALVLRMKLENKLKKEVKEISEDVKGIKGFKTGKDRRKSKQSRVRGM